jgi:hypothetical protein
MNEAHEGKKMEIPIYDEKNVFLSLRRSEKNTERRIL